MKNFIFFSLLNLPSVFMLLIKKREITLDWEPLSAAEGWPVNVRITQLIFAPNLISTWELWTFPQPNSGTTCSWPILKYNPYPAAFILLKLKDEQVIS